MLIPSINLINVGHDNEFFWISFIYTLLFKDWLYVTWTQIKISPLTFPFFYSNPFFIYITNLIYLIYSYNHAMNLIRALPCVSIKYIPFIIWLQFIYYWCSFFSPVPTPVRKLALKKLGWKWVPKIYLHSWTYEFMNMQVLNNSSIIIVFKKIITHCFQISVVAGCCQLSYRSLGVDTVPRS